MRTIGFGEIAVILVVALLVFGPDRLPTMIKQAASFIKDLRTMVANARRDLSDSVGDLGIDQEDLKTLADLRNPKSYLREKVLDGIDPNDLGFDEIKELREDLDLPGKGKPRRGANGASTRKSGTAGSSSNRTSTSRANANGSSGPAKPSGTGAGGSESVKTVEAPVEAVTATAAPSSAGDTAESAAPRFDPDAT